MPLAEPQLDALMARLAEGDREAFAPVFEMLWGPVCRLCVTLLKNDADAADAAQETMKKLFERAAEYDRARPAMPWALAIAGWECRTVRRRRARRREQSDRDGDPRAATPSGEEDLLHRDVVAAAMVALGELSDSDQQTLAASYWDEAVAVSGATLRKRRERALQRLRRVFRRLYGLD